MRKVYIKILFILLFNIPFIYADEVLQLKEGVRRATSPPPILFLYRDTIIRVVPSMSFIEIWDYKGLKEKERKFMGRKIRTALLKGDLFLILYYDEKAEIYKLPSWKRITVHEGIKPKVIKSLMNSCNSCVDFEKDRIFYVSEEGIVILEKKGRRIIKGEFNGIIVEGGKILAGGVNKLDVFDVDGLERIESIKVKGEVLFLSKFGERIIADTTEGVYLIRGRETEELVKKNFGFLGRAFRYVRFPVFIKGDLIMYPEIVRFGKFILGTEYYIKIYDLKNKRLLCNHKVLMNDSAGFISDGIIYDRNSFIYTRIDAEFLKVKCGGRK